MKRILYTDGPDEVGVGVAGRFKRGVARVVTNAMAERLLKKTSITFTLAPNKPKRPAKQKEA